MLKRSIEEESEKKVIQGRVYYPYLTDKKTET